MKAVLSRAHSTLNRSLLGSVLLCLCGAGFCLQTMAQPGQPHPAPGKGPFHQRDDAHPGMGRSLNPSQAASLAQQRFPGEVLSIKQTNETYQVKILHKGQVRVVNINANQ